MECLLSLTIYAALVSRSDAFPTLQCMRQIPDANRPETPCVPGLSEFLGYAGARTLGLRQQAFALGAFASQFPRPADGFSFLARLPFGGLLEMIAALHLAEETFTLHLLLERFQRLVDVVVADNDLNDFELSIGCPAGPG
jgi:hypothetical protein